MIRAILFDLDETLLDREASIEPFIKEQFLRCSLDHIPYEAYRRRFKQLDEHGYADKQVLFQTLVTEFALSASIEELVSDFTQNAWNHCKTLPDTKEVLRQLRRRGYKLGIITNGSTESQRAKLRNSGLSSLVDVSLISGEEQVRKPDQQIFVRAAQRLGVHVAECVFVGDNPQTDVEGALNAGMKAIWFRCHLPWPAESAIVPTYTVGTLAELLSVEF